MADKETLYDAGTDLAFEGKYSEAIESYRAALAIDPTYADALHGLIMAYKELEELDEAISLATKLCELTPDDILAHTTLSTLFQMKGMVPEAEAESAKARMLDWRQQLQGSKKSPEEV
jgi:tetratricopeptide (TPR) repeat protein